jgi:fermentation-respiration switch protein FrsA (DUF1100 family)
MQRRARRLVGIAVALLALGALYLGGAYFFAGKIVAFSRDTLAAGEAAHGRWLRGLPAPIEVSLARAGVTLAGWLFEQPGPARCGVVLSHGRGGTRYGILEYTPLVWKRGCDLVIMDARYHGASTGEYGTMGYHERHDLVAVVDWLAQRRGLSRSRIGLLGESMGAGITLQAAALMPDIGFVAVDSPFADFRAILARQGRIDYGPLVDLFLPAAVALADWRSDGDIADVNTLRHVPRIQAPVFIVHARDDALIPWQHAQEVYAAIPHQRKVVHVVDWGARHTQAIELRPDEYERLFADFLARYTTGF